MTKRSSAKLKILDMIRNHADLKGRSSMTPEILSFQTTTDLHSTLHLLYSLQKQGYISFDEGNATDWAPGRGVKNIRLTKRGQMTRQAKEGGLPRSTTTHA